MLFSALTIAAGMVAFILSQIFVPVLGTYPWLARFAWLTPVNERSTVIERTEQIILPQEEGVERLVAAPRASIVSILSVPIARSPRTLEVEEVTQMLSGVLVTNDGLIATYLNEVPRFDNRRLMVFFTDGNIAQAKFFGYDPIVNVAYFQTERSDTPAIPFVNTADVRLGQRFMALAGTADPSEVQLASGYIGERARTFNLSGKTVASADEWEGVYLPDRPFGTALLGGAAVALNGELIGLIGSLTLDATVQSFILPANALRQSLERVIKRETEGRESIGAYYVSLTPERSLQYGVSQQSGALIYTPSARAGLAVIAGSRAERAGLRYGDIVTQVQGRTIDPNWPLSVALYDAAGEATITLTVLRGESEQSVTLGQ